MIYFIKHHINGSILFKGDFESFSSCVQAAIQSHVSLDYGDFSNTNLVNANLDNGSFRHAKFHHANLMGANMSETQLDHADFTGAGLQNTCLCQSHMTRTIFYGSLFGATDITGCVLRQCVFGTTSALTLNFRDAEMVRDCIFQDSSGFSAVFNGTPLFLSGLDYPISILDRHVMIGSETISFDELHSYISGKKFNSVTVGTRKDIYNFIYSHWNIFASILNLKSVNKRTNIKSA